MKINKRGFLVGIFVALVLVGILAVIFSTLGYFRPDVVVESKTSNLPRVDVSKINKGTFIVIHHAWWKAIIMKQENGALDIFKIPFVDGVYRMPDPTWKRPMNPCNKFVFPESEKGKIDQLKYFQCVSQDFRSEYKWDYKGKSQGEWTPDLLKLTNYVRHGDNIILGLP